MKKLKILIPTDFTVQAEFGYMMVKKLEEKIPTEIHFVHVFQSTRYRYNGCFRQYPDMR